MITSGHVTKMALTPFNQPLPKTPYVARKVHVSCLIEHELLPMEVLHGGKRNFRPFCSCDLDLDTM